MGEGWSLERIRRDLTPAGFGEAGPDVPDLLRRAVLVLVAHWYENREAIAAPNAGAPVPLGVQSLLSPHRLFVPEVAA